MQKMVVTQRDCPARYIPSGRPAVIPKDIFITIVQDLGGNYTAIWQGNMLRIDGIDGDAIGREPLVLSFDDIEEGVIKLEHIWQVLDTIYDPEIPISLSQLGLIYGLEINAEICEVVVNMTLTAPGCGMGPVLLADVEYRVAQVPNVKSVKVNLVFDPPWSKEMMSEEAQLEAGFFF